MAKDHLHHTTVFRFYDRVELFTIISLLFWDTGVGVRVGGRDLSDGISWVTFLFNVAEAPLRIHSSYIQFTYVYRRKARLTFYLKGQLCA